MSRRTLLWAVIVGAMAAAIVYMAFGSGYRTGADMAQRDNGAQTGRR